MILYRKVETAIYERFEAIRTAPRVRDNKGFERGCEGAETAENQE